MKTDELIRLLSQDAPVRMRLGRALALAVAAGIVASAVLLLATVGLRDDLASAIGTVRVAFKIGMTLVLAIAAFGLVSRIGKPGVPLRPWALALLLPLALMVVAVGVELVVVPQDAWAARLIGRNAAFCLFFIPVLSLAPLAGLLAALRNGAPENPGLAGAAAGLAAGAIGAALYAWHCPDDSPLFGAAWYTLAVTFVMAVGYATGRRFLRW
ncbi:MAG: NrsF family protein [Hydrogenophaga sp.]|nr:NrsF family protein [Hydrogenophaga sp.]